jgi:hypothetical protein
MEWLDMREPFFAMLLLDLMSFGGTHESSAHWTAAVCLEPDLPGTSLF